jgi:hypothetical protein
MYKMKRKNNTLFRFDNVLRLFAIVALLLALVVILTQPNAPAPLLVPPPTPVVTAKPRDFSIYCDETSLNNAAKISSSHAIDCESITLTSTLIIDRDTTFSGRENDETILTGGDTLDTIIRVENNARLTLIDMHIADSTQFGIYLTPGARLDIHGATFSGHGSAKGDGAAIWNQDGIVDINHGIFTDNHSFDDGAGIVNWLGGSITLQNTVFRNNSVGTTADGSGAALLNHGKATIYTSLFESNASLNNNGGAIYNANGTLLIQDSNFMDNRAEQYGAALYNAEGGQVTIQNTLFRDNTAAMGGAIYNLGMLTLEAITVRGNSSDCYNGGVMLADAQAICPTVP